MRLTLTLDALSALGFARRNKGWHTFKRDKRTRRAIERLQIMKLIEVNEYGQFKAI